MAPEKARILQNFNFLCRFPPGKKSPVVSCFSAVSGSSQIQVV